MSEVHYFSVKQLHCPIKYSNKDYLWKTWLRLDWGHRGYCLSFWVWFWCLKTTANLKRQIQNHVDCSVQFQLVSVFLNNDNSPVPNGTDNQPAVQCWVWNCPKGNSLPLVGLGPCFVTFPKTLVATQRWAWWKKCVYLGPNSLPLVLVLWRVLSLNDIIWDA